MDIQKLPKEAEQLFRPCVLLKRSYDNGRLAGVWGGPGIVPAPIGPYRHWLSIHCKYLQSECGPEDGVLSVYTNEDDCVSGFAAHDSTAVLSASEGVPLYAHAEYSFPPPDAFNGGDTDEYIRAWQSNCPLYTGEADAVIGGWHFPWPDGDWEELRNQLLLVWTIADSEPWVEVWKSSGGFRVIQRIT